jgi:hypothetical protein
MTSLNDATQQKANNAALNLAVARAHFEQIATLVNTRGNKWYLVNERATLNQVATTISQITMYYQNGGDVCPEADKMISAVLETKFTDPRVNRIKTTLVSQAVPKRNERPENTITETRFPTPAPPF